VKTGFIRPIGFVDQPEHYPYSSAVDFAGEKGMIDIEPC